MLRWSACVPAHTLHAALHNPTVLARIGHQELTDLMRGYGYEPHFVEGDDPAVVHQCLAGTLDTILAQIRQIQGTARSLDAVARAI